MRIIKRDFFFFFSITNFSLRSVNQRDASRIELLTPALAVEYTRISFDSVVTSFIFNFAQSSTVRSDFKSSLFGGKFEQEVWMEFFCFQKVFYFSSNRNNNNSAAQINVEASKLKIITTTMIILFIINKYFPKYVYHNELKTFPSSQPSGRNNFPAAWTLIK